MISSIVPVVLVLVIAVSFLNRSFQLLETQKRSILQVQMDSILHDMELEMETSRIVADQICVDSDLSRDKMLEHGLLTLKGIDRLSMYRLHLNPQLFLSYIPEQLVTKGGTSSREFYAKYTLTLTPKSTADWEQVFESKERLTSTVLESKDGSKHVLMLYYYPESGYIEEKWVGFLFGERELGRLLESTAKNLNAVAMLSLTGQAITFVDYSNDPQSDKAAFLEAARSGQAEDGYAFLESHSYAYNVNIAMAFDNSVLLDELRSEAIWMFAIGLVAVVLLTCFIWYYGKYRYRFLNEIKQLAVSGRPELSTVTDADEYEIIRTVLKQNFEELKTKNDDLMLFRKKAKQQMSWMLLCGFPAEGVDISQIMEGYGIENRGHYYSAMLFWLQNELNDEQIYMDDVPDVLLSSMFEENANHYFVLGLSLLSKDANHHRRQEVAQIVLEKLDRENIRCWAVSCGLVYEELTKIGTSKQEAYSILQTQTVSGGMRGKVLFFDELTHLPNNISQTIEDNLNQFTEALRSEDGTEAANVLKRLLTGELDETYLSYIKYKLVRNVLDVMYEMEISLEYMDDLDKLVYLDAEGFEKQMSELISKLFIKLRKKDVTDANILAYIESNYNNSEISMRTIADHFGISERSISRVLKKSINKTYKEYLSQIRLEHACKLLIETDMDVRVIIKEVGYYDVSSFNRLFKQAFQMTPMEYRTENSKK